MKLENFFFLRMSKKPQRPETCLLPSWKSWLYWTLPSPLTWVPLWNIHIEFDFLQIITCFVTTAWWSFRLFGCQLYSSLAKPLVQCCASPTRGTGRIRLMIPHSPYFAVTQAHLFYLYALHWIKPVSQRYFSGSINKYFWKHQLPESFYIIVAIKYLG